MEDDELLDDEELDELLEDELELEEEFAPDTPPQAESTVANPAVATMARRRFRKKEPLIRFPRGLAAMMAMKFRTQGGKA